MLEVEETEQRFQILSRQKRTKCSNTVTENMHHETEENKDIYRRS